MYSLQVLGATTFALLIVVCVVWRLSSRRHTLPCPAWLGWMVELENPFASTHRADFIVRQLELSRGMRVLDAGCGPGRVTIPIAKAVGPEGTVVAADLQDRMLRAVMSKARSVGLRNLFTLKLGIGQGQLEANSFDRVVMAAVLGEIPDRQAAMHELCHCLKPGGLLAIAELIFDPHFQTRSKVRQLALVAGFKERASFGGRLAYLLVFERPK